MPNSDVTGSTSISFVSFASLFSCMLPQAYRPMAANTPMKPPKMRPSSGISMPQAAKITTASSTPPMPKLRCRATAFTRSASRAASWGCTLVLK